MLKIKYLILLLIALPVNAAKIQSPIDKALQEALKEAKKREIVSRRIYLKNKLTRINIQQKIKERQ